MASKGGRKAAILYIPTKKELLHMSANQNQQKNVTIGEKEFTLQHPGVREAIKLRGRAKDHTGQLDEEKYYEELMKHVIVQPKVTWETAEDLGASDFNELIKEASLFLNGKA